MILHDMKGLRTTQGYTPPAHERNASIVIQVLVYEYLSENYKNNPGIIFLKFEYTLKK